MTASRIHQQGFSLLEAIVALTIMSTCLLALYAWLSTSTLSLNRASAHALALQDARTAKAVVDTINPLMTPEGTRELPPLLIRWNATPVSERRYGMTVSGGANQFDFMLYELAVEVLRDGHPVYTFTTRKTGWENARPIPLDEL